MFFTSTKLSPAGAALFPSKSSVGPRGLFFARHPECMDALRALDTTPPPGLRPAAVALRATQNSGLAFSSDRRAPDPSRQSADGCALWSRLETRYLRLPSPLRHNIFPPDANALWSTFGRGSALATRCPSSLPLCFRHRQQFVDRESSSSPVSTPLPIRGLRVWLTWARGGRRGACRPPARAKPAPVLGAVKQTTLDRTCGPAPSPRWRRSGQGKWIMRKGKEGSS
jgi:hypothetical protein